MLLPEGLGEREFSLKNLISTLFDLIGQGKRKGFGAIFVGDNAGDGSCLNRRGNVNVQGAGLIRHQGSEGVFINQLLGIEKNTHIVLLGLVCVLWDEPKCIIHYFPAKGKSLGGKTAGL